MNCPVCGAANRAEARFCQQCGASLLASHGTDAPPAPAPAAAEPALAEPASEPPASEPPASEPPPPQGPDGDDPPPAPPPAGLTPLVPGARVAGRFEIVELREAGQDANLYLARDTARCPVCRAEGVRAGSEFCEECGADLETAGEPPLVELCETRLAGDAAAAAETGHVEGDRAYSVQQEQPAMSPAPHKPLRLQAGCASDVGQRALDEDSLCTFTLGGVYESVPGPVMGMFIVADGMGGHEGGEVASRAVVEVVATQIARRLLLPRFAGTYTPEPAAIRGHIVKAIADANQKIFQMAGERSSDMGSTITLAVVMDGRAYIANAGDSRTYLLHDGKLRQLTIDHSMVATLVASGAITPDEIYTHPDRNVVYKGIGLKPALDADTFEQDLAPGDVLLLCCDGLWEAVRSEGIEDVLLRGLEPQAACDELVRQANLAGGEDNISVIVVHAAG